MVSTNQATRNRQWIYGADHLETMTFVQAQNQQWKKICNPNPNPKMAARDRGHLSPNFRLKKA
jgi:hypothetical protein